MSYRTTYVEYTETTRGNRTEGSGLIYRAECEERGVSELMLFTRTQQRLMDSTRELRELTDQISKYRESPETVETTRSHLPSLMALMMERREQARRQYKDVLTTKFSEHHWDLDTTVKELEAELARTDELLSLYPHRGSSR
ncbi:Heterotrimeric G protein gamma subunit GPG1 [Nakaseomyces bracarensis]|uniref:Heterotrimeric G protein gamma subunit GPG1 n=1 Tax=Nakaseomyces bracarensis TaxID=273131 RepID=A0ABR4NPZ7_9SACH